MLSVPVLFNILERNGFLEFFQPTIVYSLNELLDRIQTDRMSVAVYSFMTPHLAEVWREVQAVRERFGERPFLMAGGAHAAGDAESVLTLGFDAVSRGEGESTLPRMLRMILDEPDALHGKIVDSGQGESDDHHLFTGDSPVDLDESFPIALTTTLMSPLELTRGCFWRCRFCQTSLERPRTRSLESVKTYLDELKRRGYLSRAGFIAPSGFEFASPGPGEMNLEAVEAVLKMGKEAGIRHLEFGVFPSELRPNTVSPQGFSLIRKYCSNRKVTIGAQSGCNETLKMLRRGHTTQDIERATALSREAGITPMLDFILGFPGETEEKQLSTVEYAKYLNDRYHARAQMHFFMPLSGTPLEEEMPTFLSERVQKRLARYNRDGVCTNWWKEGMALSREIIETRERLESIG